MSGFHSAFLSALISGTLFMRLISARDNLIGADTLFGDDL